MTKLTPTQIEIIEDLTLDGDDKWYAALAVTGHKKASWLQLRSPVWREGDTPSAVPAEYIELTKRQLEALGLEYTMQFRITDAGLFQPAEGVALRTRYNQLCDLFIANSHPALEALVAAHAVWDHKAIGHALDYPASAVNAFDSDEALEVNQIPDGEFDEYVLENLHFILSKSHYREELEVVKSWLKVIDEIDSPILRYDLGKTHL